MLPAPFQCRHLAIATEKYNFTDCAMCVIGRSAMGQIVEFPTGRTYGSEVATNRNRTSAVNTK
jgi:hypothetical protein